MIFATGNYYFTEVKSQNKVKCMLLQTKFKIQKKFKKYLYPAQIKHRGILHLLKMALIIKQYDVTGAFNKCVKFKIKNIIYKSMICN